MPDMDPGLPLRDVIAPQGALWWPPAPAWWLLIIGCLILAWFVFRALRKRFISEFGPLRKAALRELGTLQLRTELSDPEFAEQISALLKRVAILRYAEQHPAGLSGEAWLTFLDQSSEQANFSALGEKGLLDAQYRTCGDVDRQALLQAAGNWIRAI